MHGAIGREEKAGNHGNKSAGGTGNRADSSRIEKGHSSSSTGGSGEGAQGLEVTFAWAAERYGDRGRRGRRGPIKSVNTT